MSKVWMTQAELKAAYKERERLLGEMIERLDTILSDCRPAVRRHVAQEIMQLETLLVI
jgi:hypothetical protein